MAKKSQTKKARISAREFGTEFTAIVGGHLATLPPEEQDRRLRAAKRVITRSLGNPEASSRLN